MHWGKFPPNWGSIGVPVPVGTLMAGPPPPNWMRTRKLGEWGAPHQFHHCVRSDAAPWGWRVRLLDALTGWPGSCLNSTGSTSPLVAMIWTDEGTARLQADPAVLVSLIPVVSDDVAPWVPAVTPRAFAEQEERATIGGAATVVDVGGFGARLVGPAGDPLTRQTPMAEANTMKTAPKANSRRRR